MSTSCINRKSVYTSQARPNFYSCLRSILYKTTSTWVFWSPFLYCRCSLWINIFYCYRVSWPSRYYWDPLSFNLSYSTSLWSLLFLSPLWVWSSSLVLTLCWCSLIIFIHFNLLMRRLSFKYNSVHLASNQEDSYGEKIIVILFIALCLLGVVFIVILLALILSDKNSLHREKATPFECGFDINSANRIPFSLRFFLITIIFLIFDVEIVILIPYLKAFNESLFLFWLPTTLTFIIVLILGLVHEWNQGALKWSFWRYSQLWHLNCTQIVFLNCLQDLK